MRIKVLSSGSKGNTTYIEHNNTKIIIDMGNTCKYVISKLKEIEVNPKDIDAILITHTHSDHIKGLKVFLNKYSTKVYFTEKMHKELPFITNYSYITNSNLTIKDLIVDVIKTSHDVEDSVGYIITGDKKTVVYITDTGYINQKYFDILSNREVYILESNHDIEMLNNGPYSFQLRKRILGDKGHLSNYDCSRYLSSLIGNNTKCIMLAHLSEENNTKELAYNTLIEKLTENKQAVDKIIILEQDNPSEEVVI